VRQWVAADLRTGRVLADLPSLTPSYPLRDALSSSATATATLHLDGAPENWRRATKPGGALLVCYDDADERLPIQWAGWVQRRSSDAASDEVKLGLATLPAYFDERFVGDQLYATSATRDSIVSDILRTYVVDSTDAPGIPLRLAYSGGGDSPAQDIIMQNTDNATVSQRLGEVFGQLGGEYVITWGWSADGMSVVPTMRWGDSLGTAKRDGYDPAVTFEMPGTLTGFTQDEAYGSGKGANAVVAYSTADDADVTPVTDPIYAPDLEGRPTFEHRDQPARSTELPGLRQYAARLAKLLEPGAVVVTLDTTTAYADGRRLGADWFIGDDVGYRVDPTPAFPAGVASYGRAIAVDLGETSVTPILADSALYGS
jgi:hypothetical protein